MERETPGLSLHSRGFSLLEVILALAVLVIGLYGVLDLLKASQHTSGRAHHRAVAIELARGKMAELQAAGYDAVERLWPKAPDGSFPPFTQPAQPAEFTAPYKAPRYWWQARFSRLDGQPGAISVEVRVLWGQTATTDPGELLERSVSVGALLVK